MDGRDEYERLDDDNADNAVEVDAQQQLLDAVAARGDAETSLHAVENNTLNAALSSFLTRANVPLQDNELVDTLTALIVHHPSTESRLEFTRFVIRQYTYSGLQELLRLIAISGLAAWSYYVARLFGQLAIEAAIVMGEETGYTLLRDDDTLHYILGQVSVISSMAVYIRYGHDTSIAEYKALKHFIGDRKINWKNFAMRVAAIVPAACMGIIAYTKNPLYYSLSLSGFLYCLLAPAMAGLNKKSLRQKAMSLLKGSPTMSHAITPFTLKLRNDGLTVALHYSFGIIALLTFPQFASLGVSILIEQAKTDATRVMACWKQDKLKGAGTGLLYSVKWLLTTTIGTLSGLPTAMMGYNLLKHYGLANNPIAVLVVMGFCSLTGNEAQQHVLNDVIDNTPAYLSHLTWKTTKDLATLPRNCYELGCNFYAWFNDKPTPPSNALERIQAKAATQQLIQKTLL